MSAAVLSLNSSVPLTFTPTPVKAPPTLNDWHTYVPKSDPIQLQLAKENTAWVRFKEFFHRNSALCKEVMALSQKSNLSANWNSNLTKIVKSLDSDDYIRLRPSLRQLLVKMTSGQRAELFGKLVKVNEKGELKGLRNCLDLITYDELQQMFNMKTDDIKVVIKCLAECEKELRDSNAEFAKMTSHSASTAIGNLFHGFIDTILMSVSFFEIGKEPNSAWDASYMIKTYAEIIAAPLAIFAALSTAVPLTQAILITAGIVLALILMLAAYVKWLKPCPENIEPCINLTALAKQGRLEPVVGRDAEIDKVIQCLASANDGARAHPLLTGKSGVGKTEIIKGLALRIAQGKVPDSLKGKKVFMVNTANLMKQDMYDSQDKLQRMISRIGRNKKDVIIFFDEIHKPFKDKAKMAETLKNVTDTTPDGLPYCIGATNEEQHLKSDPAIWGRFEEIVIKETAPAETKWIMREMTQRIAKDVPISDASLEQIIKETSTNTNKFTNCSQPKISKRVLSKAISNLRMQQSGYAASEDVRKKRSERDKMMSEYRQTQDQSLLNKIVDIEKEIEDNVKKQKKDEVHYKELAELTAFRTQQNESLFKLAYELTHGALQKNAKVQESSKKFIRFMQEFVLRDLNTRIDHIQTKVLKIKSIEECIHDELYSNSAPAPKKAVKSAKPTVKYLSKGKVTVQKSTKPNTLNFSINI